VLFEQKLLIFTTISDIIYIIYIIIRTDGDRLMKRNDDYNGALTREQFLFYEIRIVAKLLCDGNTYDEALEKIKSDNLFQFPTERMISSIFNVCIRRIEALDSEILTDYLAHSSSDIAKQINLYAMMCYNGIVRDFMIYVIGEKYRTQEFGFSQKDLNVFFAELRERIEGIENWSDSTISKIKQVLKKSLVECEYLDTVKSNRLNPVYLYPELEDVIREKNALQVLPAFNCFM
jgi:hypothetical protein